jgi:hypothetical protein
MWTELCVASAGVNIARRATWIISRLCFSILEETLWRGVCVCVHVNVCEWVCDCVCGCGHMSMSVYIHMCACMYMYICMCVCVCVCVCVCPRALICSGSSREKQKRVSSLTGLLSKPYAGDIYILISCSTHFPMTYFCAMNFWAKITS